MKKLYLLMSCFIPLLFPPLGLADNTSEEDAYLAEYKARYDVAYQRMVESGEVESCAEEGGWIAPAGRSQMPFCYIHYADAGKACKNSNDCMGDCLAIGKVEHGESVEGQCQVNNNIFGCFILVEDGIAHNMGCRD